MYNALCATLPKSNDLSLKKKAGGGEQLNPTPDLLEDLSCALLTSKYSSYSYCLWNWILLINKKEWKEKEEL